MENYIKGKLCIPLYRDNEQVKGAGIDSIICVAI
jgi:hypothetical protein